MILRLNPIWVGIMKLEKKKEVLNRLSYLIGHLEGNKKMVQANEYCVDVIRQNQAVVGALNKVNNINLGRVPIIVLFLVPTAILIGLGVWFLTSSSFIQPQDKTKPAEVSNSIEGVQEFDIDGENHIPQGTPGSGYNSNPPSSA